MKPSEIAVEVIRRITEYPDTYDQESWFRHNYLAGVHVYDMDTKNPTVERWAKCGTTACVAGHAVAVGLGNEHAPGLVHPLLSIKEGARQLLDLSHDTADYLFAPERSTMEVIAALEEIAAGKISHPDEP